MTACSSLQLPDEAATTDLGAQLARAVEADPGGVIFLQGDLGAGKTCLARSLIHSLGHQGRVVSPTYTLLEPYSMNDFTVFHLDLYRLSDPEELVMLGIRDIDTEVDLMLVEWPEHGLGALPKMDLCLHLQDAEEGRGRVIEARPETAKGARWWSAAQPLTST